ncbi:hypothetical protein [Salinimonas chungwhensis]|uniref:hypothetical protein n=1 Tax=Salinimonas chungwhensis TaxID=265425 RepID=UPI0003828167|nr:hypothetical protein [Salinimonas chungwhensis]
MDSEFYLSSNNNEKTLALTEEQFRELKRARKRLSLIHAVSYKYKLVLSNYQLVEENMAQLGELYTSQHNISDIERIRPQLNASINNYVLSARIFTSQLKRHVQSCLPLERELVTQLSDQMDKLYKNSFAYRFVDSMYDYVTYYGLSVHAFRCRSFVRLDEQEQPVREYDFRAYIEREYIGGPADFRASVLTETPDRVDVLALLAEFNKSLEILHNQAMSMLTAVLTKSRTSVAEFVNVFIGQFGNQHANVFVIHKTRAFGDKVYESFPLSVYLDNELLAEQV